MAKLNRTGKPSGTGPLGTTGRAAVTHQGGKGFERNPKTELFLRGTTMFAGQKTFYESADHHDARSIELATAIAAGDWDWTTGFLPWLRSGANIRTMPIMLTANVVHEMLADGFRPAEGQMTSRQIVSSVIQRTDELKEMLQYWVRTFGHNVPQPVKRGVADAASRMITQGNALRWDKPGPMMLADVIEMTHPRKRLLTTPEGMVEDSIQGRLYEHLITARHSREGYVPSSALTQVRARWDLSRMDPADRHRIAEDSLFGDQDSSALIRDAAAGQWEWVMSWLGEPGGNQLSKRQQWTLVTEVTGLGYMALLRNIRNLDEAGLDNSLAQRLCRRIADPDEVARSRQLPFRFLAAHMNAPHVRWANALEQAIQACIPNVPYLDGRTLILIDTSGSMTATIGGGPAFRGNRTSVSKSPTMMQAAALFALALALKNLGNVDVWGFANTQFIVDPASLKGVSLLRAVDAFTAQSGKVGHGTEIERAVRDTYKGQDRVIVFTDMQTVFSPHGDIAAAVPADIHFYGFNLAGYRGSGMASGSMYRHELGGLTDHTFRLISLLEMGAAGVWPWEMAKTLIPVMDQEDDD